MTHDAEQSAMSPASDDVNDYESYLRRPTYKCSTVVRYRIVKWKTPCSNGGREQTAAALVADSPRHQQQQHRQTDRQRRREKCRPAHRGRTQFSTSAACMHRSAANRTSYMYTVSQKQENIVVHYFNKSGCILRNLWPETPRRNCETKSLTNVYFTLLMLLLYLANLVTVFYYTTRTSKQKQRCITASVVNDRNKHCS